MPGAMRKIEGGAGRRDEGDVAVSVLAQLAALKQMTVSELKAKWEAIFATPAPNNSRGYLELRIGHRIQELTHGGLSRETRRTLDLLADATEEKSQRRSIVFDARTPVIGTRLVREWDQVEHTVTVMRDGFDWRGRRFKSLSAVARAITGTRWNGFRFFGLRAGGRVER